jgi:hypothetical protein
MLSRRTLAAGTDPLALGFLGRGLPTCKHANNKNTHFQPQSPAVTVPAKSSVTSSDTYAVRTTVGAAGSRPAKMAIALPLADHAPEVRRTQALTDSLFRLSFFADFFCFLL